MSVCAQAFVAPVLAFTGMCAPGITLRSSDPHSKRPCLPNHLASPRGGFVVSLCAGHARQTHLPELYCPPKLPNLMNLSLYVLHAFILLLNKSAKHELGK